MTVPVSHLFAQPARWSRDIRAGRHPGARCGLAPRSAMEDSARVRASAVRQSRQARSPSSTPGAGGGIGPESLITGATVFNDRSAARARRSGPRLDSSQTTSWSLSSGEALLHGIPYHPGTDAGSAGTGGSPRYESAANRRDLTRRSDPRVDARGPACVRTTFARDGGRLGNEMGGHRSQLPWPSTTSRSTGSRFARTASITGRRSSPWGTDRAAPLGPWRSRLNLQVKVAESPTCGGFAKPLLAVGLVPVSTTSDLSLDEARDLSRWLVPRLNRVWIGFGSSDPWFRIGIFRRIGWSS